MCFSNSPTTGSLSAGSIIAKAVQGHCQGYVTPKPKDRFRISQRWQASIFRAHLPAGGPRQKP
jgi:hypothetical protein